MSPRRAGRNGFTLLELLIAVALFGVVMSGVAAMTATAVRGQVRLLGAAVLDNAATLERRALATTLQSATFVELPGPGEISSALTAWTNRADDGVTPLVAGLPVRFAHQCVAADGESLHLYTGTAPMPAIVCGEEASGAAHAVIASGPLFQVTARFYRPDEAPDLVQADVALTLTKDGVVHASNVQTQVVIRHAKD